MTTARALIAAVVCLLATVVPARASASGVITTVAGTGAGEYAGDGGPATHAGLSNPLDVDVSSDGDIVIADTGNHRIRLVDADTGVITTIAGTGVAGFSGDDGPGAQAAIASPNSVAFAPDGDVVFADTGNSRVRRVDGSTGAITTIAGNGRCDGAPGDGGSATSAPLCLPHAVAVAPNGDLVIAQGSWIRRVDTAGIIRTVAGVGSCGYGGDDGSAEYAHMCEPYGIAIDGARMLITDTNNSRIRAVENGRIARVAGNGARHNELLAFGEGTLGMIAPVSLPPDLIGDGGPALDAAIYFPHDVAADGAGGFYIADSGFGRIRHVNATGVITTAAGNGARTYAGDGGLATQASLSFPSGIARSATGDLYIADTANNRIRKVSGTG